MTMTKKTFKLTNARLRQAQKLGEEISELHNRDTLPVDPFGIARSERPLLKLVAEDFGDAFDGQLEYHRRENRFILFLNTKYDSVAGGVHRRTRFSLGHELGHYFLEGHRAYLMGGGKSHGSASEFRSDATVEREADAFAAGLMMPSSLVRSIINRAEPTFDRILEAAESFDMSVLSTAIRTVQLSDFPCALVGIQQRCVAWTFPSESLIEGGCYPAERGGSVSETPSAQWEEFRLGVADRHSSGGRVGNWFRTYDRDDLDSLYVQEEYFPVPVMDTLLVLLTVAEDGLFEDSDD